MALSAHDIEATDAALVAANGHISVAAEALGIAAATLRKRITNHPTLRSRWCSVPDEPPPPEDITVARKNAIAKKVADHALKSEEEIARKIAAEDAKFHQGFSAFGFNAEELEMATKLQSFHGKHFNKCVDMVTGGLTVTAVRVMLLAQDLSVRLTTAPVINKLTGEDRLKALEEQRMMWNAFNRLCENLTRMSEAAANGTAIRAKIQMMREQAKAASTKPQPGKAGFTPLLAIKAEGPVTIHSSEPHGPPHGQ